MWKPTLLNIFNFVFFFLAAVSSSVWCKGKLCISVWTYHLTPADLQRGHFQRWWLLIRPDGIQFSHAQVIPCMLVNHICGLDNIYIYIYIYIYKLWSFQLSFNSHAHTFVYYSVLLNWVNYLYSLSVFDMLIREPTDI